MEVLTHPQSYPDTNKSRQTLWVKAPFFKKFTTGLGIFNPNMQEAKTDLHVTEVSLIYKEVTDHQELHSETMSLKEKRKETYYPTKTKHILKNKEFLKDIHQNTKKYNETAFSFMYLSSNLRSQWGIVYACYFSIWKAEATKI